MRDSSEHAGPISQTPCGYRPLRNRHFSATLLILRATDLLHDAGRSTTDAVVIAVLLYALHNAPTRSPPTRRAHSPTASDARAVLIAGIVLFALACVAFIPASPNIAVLGVLFAAVGASTGMVETAQGSYAAELLEPSVRGRGFGLLGLVEGVGDLTSSVVVGTLWTITNPPWGFVFAALLAAVGALS